MPAAQVTAGAGVTLARLQAHARGAGWEYGVDLGARDSATVGGMIATNAGGVHVLRYGPTRRQVVGVQAVLADGSVIERLDGLEKDNTGYDLAALLCGSEGTLAVVTAARLRLVPRARHVVVALLAFATSTPRSRRSASSAATSTRLRALEFFEQTGLELVCEQLGARAGRSATSHARVRARRSGGPRAIPTDDARRGGRRRSPASRDVAVATDPRGGASLWRYREGAHRGDQPARAAAQARRDACRPTSSAEFFAAVRPAVASVAPGAQVWLFGHAGDGNVHVNVTGVEPDDDRVTDAVLRLVAELHGSISAEHGIGDGQAALDAPHADRRRSCARSGDQGRARSERHR